MCGYKKRDMFFFCAVAALFWHLVRDSLIKSQNENLSFYKSSRN